MRQEKPSGFEFRVGLERDPVPAERDVVQLVVLVVALQGRGERIALLCMDRCAYMGRAHGRSTGERSDPRAEAGDRVEPVGPGPCGPCRCGSWYTNRSVYASRAGVKILGFSTAHKLLRSLSRIFHGVMGGPGAHIHVEELRSSRVSGLMTLNKSKTKVFSCFGSDDSQ